MKREKNFLYSFFKPIYTILMKIIFRPKIIGKENIPEDGALIFAGNHKHAVDPIMVMMSTNRLVHFMAKEFLFKGIHGWVFRKIGLIEVHTTNRNRNVSSIMMAEEVLKKGGTLGIFPEGTRNRINDGLLKFRHGTVLIAKKTNTKILPFAIRGKYKPFRKSVVIEFGKPIDISKMDTDQANEYLKNEVLRLLSK